MHANEDLHNRVVKLEVGQKELLDKKEEAFFFHTKNQMDVQEIKDQVKEIHQAIVGNEPMGHVGMIKRISLVEERMTRQEEFATNFKVIIAKIGAVGGVIGFVLAFLIERLIKWIF
jgi:hypothetical protein